MINRGIALAAKHSLVLRAGGPAVAHRAAARQLNVPSTRPHFIAEQTKAATALNWREIGQREHFVQFYEDDSFLIKAVSDYVGAALASGEAALVIATPAHRAQIEMRLAQGGMDLSAAARRGDFLLADAAATLAGFMIDDMPDAQLFHDRVGGLVRGVVRRGKALRAFGEMVALLWEDGKDAAAVRLEELWNELAKEEAFALFCAYPIARFGSERGSNSFASICGCHTRVIPAESYSGLVEPDDRERAITALQQKAQRLENEIAKRREADAALVRRERELSDFLENAVEGLHQVGPTGRILWANKAELEMLGYAPDEYIGHDIRSFHVDRELIEEMLARLLRGEKLYDIAARLRCKDGRVKHVLVHSSGYFENGEFVHSRCFTRDVTILKKAEESQLSLLAAERAALAEAERVSRMKDEFLATLSHELRTPLNAILGWAEIIKDAPTDAELVAEGVAVIDRNVRAQSRLIEELLDMSRIASGKIELDMRLIELAPIIEAAVQAVQPLAEAKQISIHRFPDPLVSAVNGDPNRLQQVIWNLLTNAIKFTPSGGTVKVSLERVNSQVEISVSDTGRGIGPEFLPHVFERFRQEDASITRRHGGLGIGLAIVKKLVEMHGGTVAAKSAGLDKGACFVISLPLPMANRAGTSTPRPSSDVGAVAIDAASARLAGVKILIVDDEADSRQLAARVLSEHRAQVLLAGSADEALKILKDARPDLLISDIGMPEKDGYELIEAVRRCRPTEGGDVRAIALTAFARTEDRVRALRAGYQLHLSKPVEPKELVVMAASLTPTEKHGI